MNGKNIIIAVTVFFISLFGMFLVKKYPAPAAGVMNNIPAVSEVTERIQSAAQQQADARAAAEAQRQAEEAQRQAEEAQRQAEEAARIAAEEAARLAAAYEDGNWYVLLIGSDKRPEWNYNGNSDTMILVCVNQNTQTFRMLSFMRDIQANIPGYGARKLNSAFALSGPQLLIDTLRSNFNVKIDNYALVYFSDMINIVNTIGGIDMELNAAEAAYLGLPAGVNHLDGNQTLSYVRIRRIGNADYERTERQRRTLMAMMNRIKQMDLATQVSVATQIVGMVGTNIGADRLTWMISNMSSLLNYNIINGRVPFDGMFGHNGENLVPVQPGTNQRIYEFFH